MRIPFRFIILLITLFLYLVLGPFLEPIPFANEFMDLFLSLALIAALFTVQKNKKLRIVSIVLLCLVLFPLWFHFKFSLATKYIALILYLSVLIITLLVRFFQAKTVDANTIFAALSLYLLIGLWWGVLYALIQLMLPGSYGGGLLDTAVSPEPLLHGLIYYSFTTLTTLGYGDIFPQTLRAAALCQGEAIIGQFFTTVLIAQLVGILVAQRIKKESKDI